MRGRRPTKINRRVEILRQQPSGMDMASNLVQSAVLSARAIALILVLISCAENVADRGPTEVGASGFVSADATLNCDAQIRPNGTIGRHHS